MSHEDIDDLREPQTVDEELERTARRCAFFQKSFDVYQRRLTKQGIAGAVMCKTLLGHAIESYFLDIHRLKSFHGLQRANRYKRAGYTIKWLCQIRPISIPGIDSLITLPGIDSQKRRDLQTRALLVNADFAIIAALNWCNIDHRRLDRDIVDGLLYTAHYRSAEGNVLAQMLHAVDLAATERGRAARFKDLMDRMSIDAPADPAVA